MKTLLKLKTYLGIVSALISTGLSAQAQTEATLTNFFTPTYRGQAGSESVVWSDSFTNGFGGANRATTSAPGGLAVATASIAQTTQGAFIIGSPGGDIYSFSSTNTFVLNYSVTNAAAYVDGIGGVVFQAETAGSELAYSSVVILYTNCSGVQTVPAVRNEIFRSTGDTGFGPSSDVVSEWQWPGLPEGVTNFTIVFNGSDTSVALERVMFDVTPAVAVAGPIAWNSAPANLARWMYPFNQNPATRPTASTFAAFGNTGSFDTRDGQYLIGWNTISNVPAGQGARNYLVSSVSVTLTISSDMYYAYDGTLRDYRTYFPTNDPRHIATTDNSSVIELFGAGFRGGITNTNAGFIAYNALNYPQNGPYGASATGGDFTNRVAYAACYDTNGVLVDVSNNVGDDGTKELAHPFEVAPFALGNNTNFTPGELMPAGSQLTFTLNLNDPLIYGYVQQGLNQGNLSFIVSSLVNANYFSGTPNWPDFYTLFDVIASADQYPLLNVQGTVVRPCLDSDGDGLPDDWEQFYFGRLGVANIPNADGVSNLAKYVAGVNPNDASMDLRLLTINRQTNGTEIHFAFAPSRQYVIQSSDDAKTWQTVTNSTLQYSSDWLAKTSTNATYPSPVYAVWHDTNTVSQQQFYRVGVH